MYFDKRNFKVIIFKQYVIVNDKLYKKRNDIVFIRACPFGSGYTLQVLARVLFFLDPTLMLAVGFSLLSLTQQFLDIRFNKNIIYSD